MILSERLLVDKVKVLFVCVHNSARSQMAEAFMWKYGKGMILAESAGIEAGELNKFAVMVMKEASIDISDCNTNSVFDFFVEGRMYNYVVTVCEKEVALKCPIFPGVTERRHWLFPDPSSVQGDADEKLAQIRLIRNQIKEKVKELALEIFKKYDLKSKIDRKVY